MASLAEQEAGAVGDKVPDHVAGKIATPDLEKREDDGAGADRDQMDGSPAGEVGVGKDRDGDTPGEGYVNSLRR